MTVATEREGCCGRRGQAAIEYLVTYGWAIVAVIITIGAFAYFGVLSPSKYLPARCDFGAQMICVDYVMLAGTDDFVFLKLQNNYGEDIVIHSIGLPRDVGTGKVILLSELSGEEGAGAGPQAFPLNGVLLPNGATNDTYAVGVGLLGTEINLVPGQKVLVPIAVNFSRTTAGAPLHTVYGEIFAAPTKS